LVAFTREFFFNFLEFEMVGLHENHEMASWYLGTISAFVLKQRKTKKTYVEEEEKVERGFVRDSIFQGWGNKVFLL
jgi:hypothetical protein